MQYQWLCIGSPSAAYRGYLLLIDEGTQNVLSAQQFIFFLEDQRYQVHDDPDDLLVQGALCSCVCTCGCEALCTQSLCTYVLGSVLICFT